MNIIHKDSCQKVLLQVQVIRRSEHEKQYRAECISCGAVDALTKEEVDDWHKLKPTIRVPFGDPMTVNEHGEFVPA